MAKKALGKGIDALIHSGSEEEKQESGQEGGIRTIPVDLISANPEQPRKHFSEESLKELADSIQSQGVLQPILVSRYEEGFRVIAGERRLRAARLAGLNEIPALVRELAPAEELELALVENIQREDLDPIEEAQAYRKLMDDNGLNQEQLAKQVGKNRSTIANSLRLLNLPEEIQSALAEFTLFAGHARALLSVEKPEDQLEVFHRVVKEGLSVRETEALARGDALPPAGGPPPAADAQAGDAQAGESGADTATKKSSSGKHGDSGREQPKDPQIREIEEQLIHHLGTRVRIRGDLNRGKVEIDYFSMDDLDGLMELLGSK
ncbi:MAG: ParB/RepB/Spo0J family partition protein [Spirochaetales bacterium]|nr:ParB/RepB/Spo0J family partition protein [Spirochaetales bacterium]MCF7939771.1 ParB/RepB/Spo0J family partition protein [Spirochaetales bacterium]